MLISYMTWSLNLVMILSKTLQHQIFKLTAMCLWDGQLGRHKLMENTMTCLDIVRIMSGKSWSGYILWMAESCRNILKEHEIYLNSFIILQFSSSADIWTPTHPHPPQTPTPTPNPHPTLPPPRQNTFKDKFPGWNVIQTLTDTYLIDNINFRNELRKKIVQYMYVYI